MTSRIVRQFRPQFLPQSALQFGPQSSPPAGARTCFAAADVREESSRLTWLGRHVPVPDVRGCVSAPEEAWLLMSALPGRTAAQVLESNADCRDSVVDALARFLRRLHVVPLQDCPFDSGHLPLLARARARVEAGLVDVDDFDEERWGWTAAQVLEHALSLLPLSVDPVVTHGDYKLENLLMQEGEVIGCIDVGRAGIADRYQDLATLWNCLTDFGAPLQQRLLSSYGVPVLDERKLHFHLVLDELF